MQSARKQKQSLRRIRQFHFATPPLLPIVAKSSLAKILRERITINIDSDALFSKRLFCFVNRKIFTHQPRCCFSFSSLLSLMTKVAQPMAQASEQMRKKTGVPMLQAILRAGDLLVASSMSSMWSNFQTMRARPPDTDLESASRLQSALEREAHHQVCRQHLCHLHYDHQQCKGSVSACHHHHSSITNNTNLLIRLMRPRIWSMLHLHRVGFQMLEWYFDEQFC